MCGMFHRLSSDHGDNNSDVETFISRQLLAGPRQPTLQGVCGVL